MTTQLTQNHAQAGIVLGWYDAGTVDAGQVEAILQVLEHGQLTADCAPFDGVRESVKITESIKAAVESENGVFDLTPASPKEAKAARVAAAEAAVRATQVVCRATLERLNAADREVAWLNNIHHTAKFDKAAYDAAYAEREEAEQARKAAVQAYMTANAALDKALGSRTTR
jgi:hypothetical protein